MEAVACEGHRFCFFFSFSFFFCFHLFLFVFSSLSFPLLASSLCFLSIVLSPRQSYVAPSFIIGIAMECFRCCQGQRAILACRGRKKQEVGSAPRRMVSDLLRSPMAGPSMLLQSLSAAFCSLLLQQVHIHEDLLEDLDGLVHLVFGVRGHEGKAHQRVLRGTSRRNNRVDEDTFVKSQLRYYKCLLCITHIERNDRRFCFTDFEACIAELLQSIVSDVPDVGCVQVRT